MSVRLIIVDENRIPEAWAAKFVEKFYKGSASIGPIHAILLSQENRKNPSNFIDDFLKATGLLFKDIKSVVVTENTFIQPGPQVTFPLEPGREFVVLTNGHDGNDYGNNKNVKRHMYGIPPGEGYLHVILKQFLLYEHVMNLAGPERVAGKIADLLSDIHYGPGEDNAYAFDYGLQRQLNGTIIDALFSLKTLEDIETCIELGKKIRHGFSKTVQDRFERSTIQTIGGLRVPCAIGDIPVVDTIHYLAVRSKSNVGILFGYDISKGITYMTVKSLYKNGNFINPVSAAKLSMIAMNNAKKNFDCMRVEDDEGVKEREAVITFGGNKFNGGGSIDKLVFPHDFADWPEQPSQEEE